jgi:putative transposase
MLKTFRYKLEPNKAQRTALEKTLGVCRELYNMALEQRKSQGIGRFEQCRQLTVLRAEFSEYKDVYVHVLQNAIIRLDRAFQNFFRRCKEGGAPGFPRFRGRDRYDSFTFNNTGWKLNGNHLSLSKIGNIKARVSRPLPSDAAPKICTIKRDVDGWYATITFEFSPTPLPASDKCVGIDMGIEKFAALSDGTFIENPRYYECGQAELRRAQRRVARRKKGSHRRKKAVILLRKVHQRITNRRNDFLHKQSTRLIQQYGAIAVENLNVKGLAQGILSKQIHDASWSTFFNMLRYKAEWAGRRLVGVDARYTSQDCPACGTRKKKSLAERKHDCPCGFSTHRDTAAAINILGRMVPLGANVAEVIACVA